MIRFLIFIAIASFVPNSLASTSTYFSKDLPALAQSITAKNHPTVFKSFLDSYWKYLMETYPEWATYTGYPGQNARLSDNSLATLIEREKHAALIVQFLKRIDRLKLNPTDQVTYDIMLNDAELDQNWVRFPNEYLVLNQMGGVLQDFPNLLAAMPQEKVQDFEDRLQRLKALPEKVRNQMESLKKGLEQGVTAPQAILGKVPGILKALTPQNIEQSPFYATFKSMDSSLIVAAERTRLQEAAKAIISQDIYPVVKEFTEFVSATYIPKARKTLALTALPNGTEWYNLAIQNQTSTQLTADEIHLIGLKEVERIQGEYEKIMKQVGFKGTASQFVKSLASDKSRKFKSAQEMLTTYREIAKRADAELPRFFSKLPRLTYGVKEIPAFMAASAPAAYYENGSIETGRPGYFLLNTAQPSRQSRWEAENLTLHEAVPGHHLQIALAQEQGELHELRRNSHVTAYSEGWGLYAELLGYEMGFYKDPYSRFGQLSGEMWRACRLVVDTGLHAKNWSRQQAIDFMKKYLAKPEAEIAIEVDRYVAWPGQALAYKIGQMKISELRKRAETKLGDQFDIREFHDQVLASGAIPLSVLETRIDQWLAQRQTVIK